MMAPKNCRWEDITLMLDRELELEKTYDLLDHILECKQCQQYYKKAKILDRTIKGAELPEDLQSLLVSPNINDATQTSFLEDTTAFAPGKKTLEKKSSTVTDENNSPKEQLSQLKKQVLAMKAQLAELEKTDTSMESREIFSQNTEQSNLIT